MRFPGKASRSILLMTLALASGVVGAERVVLGSFSSGETGGWVNAGFDGIALSSYEIVTVDGRTALRGECEDSASAYVLEREVDLNRFPVMRWSWRVDSVYGDIEEQKKAGDDFPARVYAVVDGGLLKWRTRAVNYVWASGLEPGTVWPNPFQSRAMMMAVQSGAAGEWVAEARNLKEDFADYFGKDIDSIDAVAVMTDCDNHGGTGAAYFGDIYFTSDPGSRSEIYPSERE